MSGPQRGTGANEGVGISGTRRKGKRGQIKHFLMLGVKSEMYVEKETIDQRWEMLNYINSHEV